METGFKVVRSKNKNLISSIFGKTRFIKNKATKVSDGGFVTVFIDEQSAKNFIQNSSTLNGDSAVRIYKADYVPYTGTKTPTGLLAPGLVLADEVVITERIKA